MSDNASPADESVLFVLGAGCSMKSGYPSAKETVSQLKQFATGLGPDCSRLRQLVIETVDTFNRLAAIGSPAETLDDLAWLVHQGKLADNRNPTAEMANRRLVEAAKVAVAALFLSKEDGAVKAGLPGYRNLMRRIFGSHLGASYHHCLRNTHYRVLTFNYDRLFELAFRQHFSVELDKAFYGPTLLNSGLYTVVSEMAEIDLNRFSLLKLHGSIGVYSYEHHGDCEHRHSTPDPRQAPPITDGEFFFPPDHWLKRNQPNPPLITFPHEKDYLKQYPGNKLPYRVYIPAVWKAALDFARQAKEIWLVGYSCPEPDFPGWSSLLTSATICQRIVVQNPAAGSICARLKHRLPQQASLFTPHETPFEDS